MPLKTVNLEQNRPTVQQALLRLSQELRICKCGRNRALKIIHGYGSSGKGGAIKVAVLKMLAEKQHDRFISHYVRGEDFTSFTEEGRLAIELYPVLRNDHDYNRQNDGITIVLF